MLKWPYLPTQKLISATKHAHMKNSMAIVNRRPMISSSTIETISPTIPQQLTTHWVKMLQDYQGLSVLPLCFIFTWHTNSILPESWQRKVYHRFSPKLNSEYWLRHFDSPPPNVPGRAKCAKFCLNFGKWSALIHCDVETEQNVRNMKLWHRTRMSFVMTQSLQSLPVFIAAQKVQL